MRFTEKTPANNAGVSRKYTLRQNLFLLLMPVFSQSFLSFMGRHFMAFSFLTARHYFFSLEFNKLIRQKKINKKNEKIL